MRTNLAEVAAVLSHVPAGTNLVPFIEAASLVVDRELGTSSYTATTLKTIEKFLAAHLVSLDRPSRTSDSGTGVSASFHKPSAGEGLAATPHGRMVMMLDPSGKIAAAATTGPAVMFDCVEIIDPITSSAEVVE